MRRSRGSPSRPTAGGSRPAGGTRGRFAPGTSPPTVHPARLALDEKAGGEVVSLGFSPGGEALSVGDQDGGIRLWDIPSGAARPSIMAGRGRVRHVAVAPDEQALLQVNDDGLALLWEFGKERGTRTVVGSFRPAGGFLPGGDLVLIDSRGDVAPMTERR